MINTNLFTLRGIKSPGSVDVFGFGAVTLEKLTDAKLIEIYKSGRCPYLIPTDQGLEALGLKPVKVTKTPKVAGTKKGTTTKKKKQNDQQSTINNQQ